MAKKTEKRIELREMAGGCYVLTEDVQNPKPDRRAHRDWTNHETWKKGMRLFVRVGIEDVDTERTFRTWRIENIDARYSHMNIARGQHDAERWNAITAKMQQVDEDLDSLLHRLDAGGWSRARILEQLVKDGTITLAQVEAAYDKAMHEDDPVVVACNDAEGV